LELGTLKEIEARRLPLYHTQQLALLAFYHTVKQKKKVYSGAINTEDKKTRKMLPWHRMMQRHQKTSNKASGSECSL
jgi:site-specific DNA-adenine methylase